jgi:hypothetical protein
MWDNLTSTPSYQQSDKEFWASRQFPIPITSTLSSHLSGLGFTPDSNISSEAFEDPKVVEIEETAEEVNIMSGPSDPEASAEADRLEGIRERIEFKMERMRPERVKVDNIGMMKKQLDDLQELTEQYGLGVKSFLRKFSTCEEPFNQQLQADLKKLLSSVEEWENAVCAAIYSLEKSSQPSIVQPGPGGADQTQAVSASVSATAIVSDDKISRLVQKIPKYEKIKDKIKSSHSDYLEFTALHKPDHITHSPSKLNKAVYDATAAINSLIADLEEQDEERGLATMLPRKMEKVKWPTFSGKPGESFFKFKEQFLKAAKQNMTMM